MKIFSIITTILAIVFCFSFSLQQGKEYNNLYSSSISDFRKDLIQLLNSVKDADLSSEKGLDKIRNQIRSTRLKMKGLDFWLRYFEPNLYRKINGPLPVEWENEVFEKFEPPYRREGAGLSLLEENLGNDLVPRATLDSLITRSIEATKLMKQIQLRVN